MSQTTITIILSHAFRSRAKRKHNIISIRHIDNHVQRTHYRGKLDILLRA